MRYELANQSWNIQHTEGLETLGSSRVSGHADTTATLPAPRPLGVRQEAILTG